MKTIIRYYFQVIKALMAAALATMIVLVFTNVVLRYAFNSGITASEEISRWLFVYLVFLGAVVGLYEHAHLGADALIKRLPRIAQKACGLLSHALMLYCSTLLLIGSWRQVLLNLDNAAPATELPMALVYLTGVIFAAASMPILLGNMWKIWCATREEDLVLIRESEDDDLIKAAQAGLEPGHKVESVRA